LSHCNKVAQIVKKQHLRDVQPLHELVTLSG